MIPPLNPPPNHPLLDVFESVARGNHPPADGGVTFLPELQNGNRAIVALTGHAFIATSQSADEFADLHIDGFGAALHPKVVLRVADGGIVGCDDATLVARGVPGPVELTRTSQWDDHHRVRHAREIRQNVVVYGDDYGFFTIADGLGGRQEIGIELAEPGRVKGLGRHLIEQALHTIEPGSALFAAVSPGNARSLRAFLAVGFTPIGSEVIVDRSAECG